MGSDGSPHLETNTDLEASVTTLVDFNGITNEPPSINPDGAATNDPFWDFQWDAQLDQWPPSESLDLSGLSSDRTVLVVSSSATSSPNAQSSPSRSHALPQHGNSHHRTDVASTNSTIANTQAMGHDTSNGTLHQASAQSFPAHEAHESSLMDHAASSAVLQHARPNVFPQWDALHAILLYETLELEENQVELTEWKSGSRLKGLHRPLLLKMARRFWKSHPEARNPSTQLPAGILSHYGSSPTPWLTWYVGETARRTLFLINAINLLASIDLTTGDKSPYYEPLDDSAIMDLPLPCSNAIWAAGSEPEWQQKMARESDSYEIDAAEHTLKDFLSKHSTEDLLTLASTSFGLDDSDQLRAMVILCALVQFR
ncbi:MAG: hypothetical protein Q9160_008826 [Pyrenula sp. 1 TL-2023]